MWPVVARGSGVRRRWSFRRRGRQRGWGDVTRAGGRDCCQGRERRNVSTLKLTRTTFYKVYFFYKESVYKWRFFLKKVETVHWEPSGVLRHLLTIPIEVACPLSSKFWSWSRHCSILCSDPSSESSVRLS